MKSIASTYWDVMTKSGITVGGVAFVLMASTAALAGDPIPGVELHSCPPCCGNSCIVKKPDTEKAGDTVAKHPKSDTSTTDANGSISSTQDFGRKFGAPGSAAIPNQPSSQHTRHGVKSGTTNAIPGSAPTPHALLPGGTTATGAALSGMGSLSVPVVVVNKTSLVLSTNPEDLGYYYYSMTATCQHSGMPAVIGHFGIPAGQHGTMPNIVTGSTCSLQEPPPPVRHGSSGCKIGSAVWQTTYSMQPVLITAGHTSTITVTNTLVCNSDVSERTHAQQQ
jgi:hypothetical protein